MCVRVWSVECGVWIVNVMGGEVIKTPREACLCGILYSNKYLFWILM